MSNSWDELGSRQQSNNADKMRLDSKIQTLCEIHNRRLSDEARAHWLRQLLPYANGKAIYKALEAGCNHHGMPSVAWILEKMAEQARHDTKPYVALVPPTAEKKALADKHAILSLLWLHYVKGWDLARVGSETIGRLFAESIGKKHDDVAGMLVAAMEIYPRELVLAWMADQERDGN